MKEVQPEVHFIASTDPYSARMRIALDRLGANEYDVYRKPVSSPSEDLIEFAGRLCYKSFQPELNPNVKKVREDSTVYFKNILESRHGSVLEHATASILFLNVSRVFTHEVVRHRAGTAFSQESQRYVRIVEVPMWLPPSLSVTTLKGKPYEIALKHNRVPKIPTTVRMVPRYDAGELLTAEQWANGVRECWLQRLQKICCDYEEMQSWAEKVLALDVSTSFHHKKTYTSALRRGMPQGVATNILVTANHRSWRGIIEQRAAEGVEEEMLFVFYELGKIFKKQFPKIYQDMHEYQLGWVFDNKKV